MIVSLLSCMTEKRPLVSRLALRHTPNPGRFNTRRRKLKKSCESNLRVVPKNLPIVITDAEIVALLTECIYFNREKRCYSPEILAE
jgi:hypothetical protein